MMSGQTSGGTAVSPLHDLILHFVWRAFVILCLKVLVDLVEADVQGEGAAELMEAP